MKKLTADNLSELYSKTNGTHKIATLMGATYDDLVRNFGEPSINVPSGDDKVQVEWVFDFNDEIFTIYDWKTYDRNYTLQHLNHWSIGGKTRSVEAYDAFTEKFDRKVLIQPSF